MMRSYFITLLILFGVISCNSMKDKLLAPFLDGPTKVLFRAYHEIYRKDYDLNTEEGLKRYRIFKDNLNYIRQENAKNHSYKLGINQFADMTMKEIEQKMNLSSLESFMEKMKMSEQTTSVSNTKYSLGYNKIDWTEYLGPIRSQNGCGSCYATAVTSGVEANYKIFSGESVVLSPQQIVDCNMKTAGCGGGDPFTSLDYLIDNGFATEFEYPYVAKQNTCNYKNGSGKNYVKNFEMLATNIKSPLDKFVSLLNKGPLIYSISVSFPEFSFYKSGVIDYPDKSMIVNHMMVAVALLNGEGFDYLRFQNSWGKDWGDSGFVNIKVRNNSPYLFPNNGILPYSYYIGGSFYSECNFKGKRQSSVTNLMTLKDVRNNINSIRTGNGDVYVFDKDYCMGNSYLFTNDVQCSADLNDEAKFILQNAKSIVTVSSDNKAKQGCVILYFNYCLKPLDYMKEVCEDTNDLFSIGYDVMTGSIQIGEGVKSIILYNRPNFIGESITYTKSVGYIEVSNKYFGSIKIVK